MGAFPTLRAYLPQVNGASLPARAAPRALAELHRFNSETRLARSGADPSPARYLRHLRVATRPRTARDFTAIVQALDEVLRAAIETGNPVIWC